MERSPHQPDRNIGRVDGQSGFSFVQCQLSHTWQTGLGLLFPDSCLFCRSVCQPVPHFPGICRTCLSRLPLRFRNSRLVWPSDPDGNRPALGLSRPGQPTPVIFCAAYYQTPIKDALLQFKFGDATEWYKPLASLLVQTVRQSRQVYDGVVAVPLHPRRRQERGYNQAGLLAAAVAAALELPDLSAELQRVRQTRRQSEQTERSARWQNLTAAFAIDHPSVVRSRHFLLTDDILTTGATMTAAASPLWQAGARVTGLVVASGQRAADGLAGLPGTGGLDRAGSVC